MNVVALLESMWGWRGYSSEGDVIRYFHINPENFSGRRLYRIVGNHKLLVTNSCRECQATANHHGVPSPEWVLENLIYLRKQGMDLLLVCGKVAKDTFERATGFKELGGCGTEGKVTLPGMGADEFKYLCMDHPAARRWSNQTLDATHNKVQELLGQ